MRINIANEIGNRIKKIREENHLTQSQLAIKANLRQATISDYENGKTEMGISKLYRIAVVLNKPVTYFFQDIENFSNNEMDYLEGELLMLFRKISNNGYKKFVIGDVKYFVDNEGVCNE